MHRALVAALALTLGACSARLPQPQPLQRVSLKDEQPKVEPAVSRTDVQGPAVRPGTVKVLVHGGEGLTKVDLDLAMGQALRRRGYTIVTEGQAWTVTANVSQSTIDWSLTDSAGTSHASIRQHVTNPGEIRGADAVAAASAAANSVAKFIPPPKGEKL